jgi:hypothetical protein
VINADVIESLSTWEELADAGRTLALDLDAGRFALGDVGARCASVYGDDSLGKLAADIGLARAHTFREYVRVARAYQPVIRVTYLEAGLNWSHFREALRAKDDAELFLARAADDGLTVAALAREIAAAIGARVPPVKLWEGEGRVYEDGTATCIELSEFNPAFTVNMPRYQRVIVKLYAAEAANE